jgi:hypothetical protein
MIVVFPMQPPDNRYRIIPYNLPSGSMGLASSKERYPSPDYCIEIPFRFGRREVIDTEKKRLAISSDKLDVDPPSLQAKPAQLGVSHS